VLNFKYLEYFFSWIETEACLAQKTQKVFEHIDSEGFQNLESIDIGIEAFWV